MGWLSTGLGMLNLGADIYGIETNRESMNTANDMNYNVAMSTNKKNRQMQNKANRSNWRKFKRQLRLARQNMALQKEFAQHGIRWKVEDAKAAGLHPLAAMGANTISFSPQTVGAIPEQAARDQRPTPNVPNLPGVDISRAVRSMTTTAERMAQAKLDTEMQEEQLKSMKLNNIRMSRELQNSPPMPDAGPAGIIEGQTGINQIPAEQVASSRLGVEKAVRPAQQMLVMPNGKIIMTIGKAGEEALENDWFAKIQYLSERVKDGIAATTQGLSNKIFKDPEYQNAIYNTKKNIAKELGLTFQDIEYDYWTNMYRVNKKGMAKLKSNKRSN